MLVGLGVPSVHRVALAGSQMAFSRIDNALGL